MKNNKMIIGLYLSLLVLGCFKEEDLHKQTDCCPPTEKEEVKLESPVEIIWKQAIEDTTRRSSMGTPLLIGDGVFVPSNETTFLVKHKMLDKKTGALRWEWLDPLDRLVSDTGDGVRNYLDQYILMITNSDRGITVLNTQGEVVWRAHLDRNQNQYSSNSFNLLGDTVYYVHKNSYNRSTKSHLIRFTIDNWQEIDTLFTLEWQYPYFVVFTPPAVWKNGVGDEILIFQDRKFGQRHSERVEYLAYNATQKQLLWKQDSLHEMPRQLPLHSTLSIPKVKGDLAYIMSGLSVLCFHIPTGALIWESELDNKSDALWSSTLEMVDGKVIVMSQIGTSYGFDEKTGKRIWRTTGKTFIKCKSSAAYRDGVLYYTCEQELRAISTTNGEILWSIPSPAHPYGKMYNGLVMDPETGYLYLSDGRFIMCLKVKK